MYDPKRRLISAAPYADRVVHHALCRVIEPLFERSFIADTYANRKGKGTHAAIERYQHFAQRYRYVLKCDIQKFFPSIDHAILKATLRRKIGCADTLWLIDLIIDNSNPQESPLQWFPGDDLFSPLSRRKGLPIGNLTSQFWGNVYLDAFDHYAKDHLGCKGYVRYVDDFVVFSDSKHDLHHIKQLFERFLARYRVQMHPTKTQIQEVSRGVPFLGFRIYPSYRVVLKAKTKRYKRHLRQYLAGASYLPQQLEDKLNAWLGHIRFGKHYHSTQHIFEYIRKQGVNLLKHPNASWRVL